MGATIAEYFGVAPLLPDAFTRESLDR